MNYLESAEAMYRNIKTHKLQIIKIVIEKPHRNRKKTVLKIIKNIKKGLETKRRRRFGRTK